MIHTVKGFHIVNEAEVDIFLKLPCFLHGPMKGGNLISGSSAFPKSSLYIWTFSVHTLLMPSLKDFEHNLASMWNENFQMCNLGLEKAEEPEIKLPTFFRSWRKQGSSRKPSTSASLTTLKPLIVCITTNCGKFFKRLECQTILLVSWETCMQVKK